MSAGPPGPKGTTILTFRLGYSCAAAGSLIAVKATKDNRHAANFPPRDMLSSLGLRYDENGAIEPDSYLRLACRRQPLGYPRWDGFAFAPLVSKKRNTSFDRSLSMPSLGSKDVC